MRLKYNDVRYVWMAVWGAIALVSLLLLQCSNMAFESIRIQDGNNTIHLTEQPFFIGRSGNDKAVTLVVTVEYSDWQNATLEIQPLHATVQNISVMPLAPSVATPPKTVSFSTFKTRQAINFSPYLSPGLNQLVVKLRPYRDDSFICVNPQLFGASGLSTGACLGLFFAALALLLHIIRAAQLGAVAMAILAAGFGYFSLWLHIEGNLFRTNDIFYHLQFIRYMAQHWASPYQYTGNENFHPPLYYFIAGRIYGFFASPGIINPLLALRMLSLALYMAFCIYGVRALRESVAHETLEYYIGVLLLVFWPLGIMTATCINNDVALYAAWAASYYYVARWRRTRELTSLHIAIALAGVALLIKSSSYVLICVIGACIMDARLRRDMAWADLWKGNGGRCALAWLAAAMAGNMGRLLYMSLAHGAGASEAAFRWHMGGASNYAWPLLHYISFDLNNFVTHPFIGKGDTRPFLNVFLSSMLYGEYKWNYANALAGELNAVLLACLALTAAGLILGFMRRKFTLAEMTPYLAGVIIPLLAVVAFTALKHMWQTQEMRFVLPMLVPLVILFMRAMQTLRTGCWPAYWFGMGAAIALPLGGMIFYLVQFLSF